VIGALLAVMLLWLFAGIPSQAQRSSSVLGNRSYQIVAADGGVYILEVGAGRVTYKSKDECTRSLYCAAYMAP
jgi:hypothetical protein